MRVGEICAVCGQTYGSHGGYPESINNRCPDMKATTRNKWVWLESKFRPVAPAPPAPQPFSSSGITAAVAHAVEAALRDVLPYTMQASVSRVQLQGEELTCTVVLHGMGVESPQVDVPIGVTASGIPVFGPSAPSVYSNQLPGADVAAYGKPFLSPKSKYAGRECPCGMASADCEYHR